MIFQNSFFSWAGQAERISNVKNTLWSAVTGQGVTSNTGIKPVDTVLSTAASNPFKTAAVVAGGMTIAGVQAPTAVKAITQPVASKLVTSFSQAKLSTQAMVVGGGIVAANTISTSPKAAEAIIKTPSGLANFGQNIGKAIEDPSLKSITTIAKENPIITSIAAGTAVLATGVGAGSLANTIATAKNTAAMNNASGVANIPTNRDLGDIEKQAQYELKAYKIQQDTALKAAKIQAESELEMAKMQAAAAQNLARLQAASPMPMTKEVSSNPNFVTSSPALVTKPKKKAKKKTKAKPKPRKKAKKKAKKTTKSKKYKKKKKKKRS